jgi:octaprenyl-diphosphate synthase
MKREHSYLTPEDHAAVESAARGILSVSFPDFGRRLNALSPFQGGKQYRSFLLLSFAGLREPRHPAAIQYAAALELIHLSSLIHDDIIDEGEERRNQPTLHRRQGVKFALLSGDYIATQTLRAVIALGDQALSQAYADAAAAIVYGEIDQWEKKVLPSLNEAAYLEMIGYKTAALFQAASQTGARLAGLGRAEVENGAAFGRAFGLGFQMVDDVLDLGSGATRDGKSPFQDAANSLPTLPLIHAYAHASPAGRERLQALLARGPEEAEQIRLMLEEHGSIDYTLNKSQALFDQGLGKLHGFTTADLRSRLENLCRATLARAAVTATPA